MARKAAVEIKGQAGGARRVRDAIYTRRSTDQGLAQEFNSLDAQREADIQCQRHEGWDALPTFYDDGAYSGARMDRPPLRRHLDDIGRTQTR